MNTHSKASIISKATGSSIHAIHNARKTPYYRQSVSDKFQTGLEKYVHDVQFSSTQSDTTYEQSETDNVRTEDNTATSNQPSEHGSLLLENNQVVKTSIDSITDATKKVASFCQKNKRKEFCALHQQYVDDWRRKHPSEQTRPMRLTEFIWSQCKPTGPYEYDLDNPLDKSLYELSKRNTKSTRDMFAEKDKQYEKDKLDRESAKNSLDCDDISVVSKLSNQSLVDFFANSEKGLHIEPIHIDLMSSSSESSRETLNKTLGNIPMNDVDCTNTIDAIVCIRPITNVDRKHNSLVNPSRNMNNVLVSTSNTLHIPDKYSAIYYSNESDKEKVVKLTALQDDYVTPSLIEEMTQYFPKQSDITKDHLTNSIIMDRESFSGNFRKMFKNWVYVVLSRVRTLDGLFLCEKLDDTKNFDVDPKLLEEEDRLRVIEQDLINFLNR